MGGGIVAAAKPAAEGKVELFARVDERADIDALAERIGSIGAHVIDVRPKEGRIDFSADRAQIKAIGAIDGVLAIGPDFSLD